jgi:transcriptional regulator with XRE-family HTH domain
MLLGRDYLLNRNLRGGNPEAVLASRRDGTVGGGRDPARMGHPDDPRAERARELRRAGRTLAQIKAELGLRSNSQLWGWVREIPAPAWSKRPRAKDAERKRARELRTLGWTYRAIAAELGVAKASVSSWLQDPEARRSSEPWAVRRRRVAIERQTEKFEAARSVGLLTDRELLLVGATAYWAEGSKAKPWSPYQSLTFVNSDPDMIRLFLRWLHLLGVDPRHIRLTVQIHDSANVGEAERFWAGVVAVPDAVFRKPLLKHHKPATNRKNTGSRYYGCLRVYVRGSAQLYRRTEGLWYGLIDGSDPGRRRAADRLALTSELGTWSWRLVRIGRSRIV